VTGPEHYREAEEDIAATMTTDRTGDAVTAAEVRHLVMRDVTSGRNLRPAALDTPGGCPGCGRPDGVWCDPDCEYGKVSGDV
jgi:hypothetical protein